jgi:riboflavin kinase/FMN adenylyltransferase
MIALHSGYNNIPDEAQGCVLAVGNFDGVHLGHAALIQKAREIAQSLNAPLAVMSFEPHPRRFFVPAAPPFRLSLLPMKQRLLEALGVEHLFVVPFDKAFAAISADAFMQEILSNSLKIRHIVVGADFSFGHQRAGTVATLQANGRFGVTLMPPVTSPAGEIYSSTAIREFLQAGNFAKANEFLGWNNFGKNNFGGAWQMEAPVVHGDKRGRILGYPTANQLVSEYTAIPYGVYAVKLLIEGEEVWRQGVANFGIRPMFQVTTPILETFIFDFTSEIYGKMMRVCPVRFLRPEMAFTGLEELKEQIKQDCIHAVNVLESN